MGVECRRQCPNVWREAIMGQSQPMQGVDMATKADLESFVTEVRCPGDFDSILARGSLRTRRDAAGCDMRGGLVSQHGDGEGVPGSVPEPRWVWRYSPGTHCRPWGRVRFRRYYTCRGTNRNRRCGGTGARRASRCCRLRSRGKLPSSGVFNPGYPGLLDQRGGRPRYLQLQRA